MFLSIKFAEKVYTKAVKPMACDENVHHQFVRFDILHIQIEASQKIQSSSYHSLNIDSNRTNRAH